MLDGLAFPHQTLQRQSALQPGLTCGIFCNSAARAGAYRALRDFWRYAVKMYGEEELPQSFFSNKSVWLARARTFRRLVEPFDIAVYYRYALWKKWQPGRRHYHESDNR